MIDNENHLKEILVTLDKDNILKDVILIGSWSLLFYDQIFLNFKPQLRTTNLDFYVPNAKAISKGRLLDSLKELDYEINLFNCINKNI